MTHTHVQSEQNLFDLSVIVPCYNVADTLSEQLEALGNQNFNAPWEVIVSDNGSTDNTLVIAKSFRSRLPNFRIVDASNCRGAAYARNVGAKAAHGTHIAFCDADDVVAPGWIEAIRRSLENTELAASRFEGYKLNDSDILKLKNCPQQEGLLNLRYSKFLPFAGACGLALRRSDFFRLQGFDETLINGEDIDLCWRAQLNGMRLLFVPNAVIHIRLRRKPYDLYKQTFNNGYWTVPIYKRYLQYGMPIVPWTLGAKKWIYLIICFPRLLKKSTRMKWIIAFAYRWGLIRGSIKHRTLAI